MKREDLLGDAMAVKVPEKTLIGFPGIVATSDTAIIDQSNKVLDLAGYIVKKKIVSKLVLHLSRPPSCSSRKTFAEGNR
jgi:hypothetical protein